MERFRNIPIRRKLMLITMLGNCLALLLACSAFVIYEQFTYQENLSEEMETTAAIVGDNCASSLFSGDPASAGRALKSLRHQPAISVAAIYGPEGELFAEYRRPGTPDAMIPLAAGGKSYRFTRGHAEWFEGIRLDGERIGTIYIRHGMEELHNLQRNYLSIAAGILLVVAMISWVVSSRLQRVISEPLASLAGVVAQIAAKKDYSVRAVKQVEDELGRLIDGFNGMLLQIQLRDAALELARNELDSRVGERTSELADSVAMLNATLESTADGILAVSFSGDKVSYNSRFATMWRIPKEVQERGDHAEFLGVAMSQLKDPALFSSKVDELFRSGVEVDSEVLEDSEMIGFLDGRIFERHVKSQRVDGKNVGIVFNFRDVTGHKRMEAILRDSENFLHSTLDALSAHIAIIDGQGIIVKTNSAWNRFARENGYKGDRFGLGESYLSACDSCSGDCAEEGSIVARGIRAVMAGHTEEFRLEYPCHSPTEERWFVVRATRFKCEGPVHAVVSHENITARIQTEAELEKSHLALLESSRLAGMAEVATSVLHNIGNVLNSVNISCSVISENVRNFRISGVTKTAALLRENEADLAGFFTTHPGGRKLTGYLEKLSQRLSAEQTAILDEVHLLDKNIEHIKEIVSAQQNHAKNLGGSRETMALETLVEDALRLKSVSLLRHRIEVIREYAKVPDIPLEKHKALQILVNLVRNAKHALDAGDCARKRLTVRISGHESHAAISVCDNGIGIAPENLTRIFAHGFTTKKDGHGFGLHSGALAAQEMGGRLTVHSDGPNTGATFTLELPYP